MKKLLILLLVIPFLLAAGTPKESANASAYELISTENVWNFLRLNHRTGEVVQVQFTLDDVFQGVSKIVPAQVPGGTMDGRFRLHSTKNIYNFILLDTVNGAMHQVQWGLEPGDRLYDAIPEKSI